MRVIFAALAASVLFSAGCASAAFRNLPERDQKRWWDCADAIERQSCERDRGSLVNFCMSEARDKYENIKTTEGRQRYLVDMGCSPGMVNDDY